MFDHQLFNKYQFANVPINQDIFLMDEQWMAGYEQMMVEMFNGANYRAVGYISYAAVRTIGTSSMELSWYPNIYDRFHEMRVLLPKSQFVACVDCYDYDEKPHLFVRGAWLTNIHLRAHSVFAMVDAIGVRTALVDGTLNRKPLIRLRKRIDQIAKRYPAMSFVSFADSLLIKSNWFVGQYNSRIKYTYEPESVIKVLAEIRNAYRQILGMEVYAVLTQGSNEYYEDALLHISRTKNHISLNSLGLPFAQLMAIDSAARNAIRHGIHGPCELYMDENLYHSLRFKMEFAKVKGNRSKAPYHSPMSSSQTFYFYSDYQTIRDALEPARTKRTTGTSKKSRS